MASSTDEFQTSGVDSSNDTIGIETLPPLTGTRWVTSRKAQLIRAIRSGIITIEEASRRYRLTIDELSEWQTSFDKHGKRGLRTTFIQQYRVMRGGNTRPPQ